MIEGVRDKALHEGIIDKTTFDKGIKDLYRTTKEDGIFCYTFFKAIAERQLPCICGNPPAADLRPRQAHNLGLFFQEGIEFV